MTQPSETDNPRAIALRPPAQVMRLARLGAFHQSRLSFMRILLRRMRAQSWRFDTPLFDIDARGVGRAVYTVHTPERAYSLVAFAHDLPDDQRSDRVIAEAWDTTFALFDGIPTTADIDRLAANVPLQEAGRISETELTLSRANRSVRLFAHVLDRLATGQQPDRDAIESVGYLMRTTAVYGSGKFGAADRDDIAARPECAAPFQVEMLTVYLIRCFVLDLVDHMARARSPDTAVPLAPDLRRRLGIGNSTGLGMAPFLINHPALLNNWIAARETALARVRGVQTATPGAARTFLDRLARADRMVSLWRSDHPIQARKLAVLRADMDLLSAHVAGFELTVPQPWDTLYRWSDANLGEDAQELLVSLLLEPYGDLVDDLADDMACDESAFHRLDGTMTVARMQALLAAHYDWALAIDWAARDAQARAWYVSEEKLEPRLGERFDEPIAEYEQPLSPGRDAAALAETLNAFDPATPLATVLLRHPEHRHIARRVQLVDRCPYAEIRDNTIGADLLPIDMLRCKLSFFGAGHFDPRSDRWVRINMFQGAPFPADLGSGVDDWSYPDPPAP